MIQKFEIHGEHTVIDEALRKYVTKKIGKLDRYIPRKGRPSAHAEVHLIEDRKKKDNAHCTCRVELRLPKATIVIEEHALNMYAAIDIVEVKLKLQIQKYKDKHQNGKMSRKIFGRLRRQGKFS